MRITHEYHLLKLVDLLIANDVDSTLAWGRFSHEVELLVVLLRQEHNISRVLHCLDALDLPLVFPLLSQLIISVVLIVGVARLLITPTANRDLNTSLLLVLAEAELWHSDLDD